MKKIIFFFFVMTIALFAQDVNTAVEKMYSDTLTATVDTVNLILQSEHQYVAVYFKTTSGTDTVTVATRSGGGTFVPRALINMADKSQTENAIITTTAAEYLVFHPEIIEMQITTADASASCLFTVYTLREGR